MRGLFCHTPSLVRRARPARRRATAGTARGLGRPGQGARAGGGRGERCERPWGAIGATRKKKKKKRRTTDFVVEVESAPNNVQWGGNPFSVATSCKN